MTDWPRRLRLLALPFLALGFPAAGCTPFRLAAPTAEKVEKEPPPPVPRQASLRVSQFVFTADFELNPDLPVFKELGSLRDQVLKQLRLPPANTLVQVYLFEDRDRYEQFMKGKYPDLPTRRAFFVAQPRSVGGGEDLSVYTFWGDKVQQDLRHELTHALLHSVLKDVPLWLDEGLAQYFEVPADWKGVNYQHVEQLRRGAFKPDLARLEQMSQVQQMNPAEYREAWAWAHLMLEGPPEGRAVLMSYLQTLRTNPAPGPLGPKLASAVPDLDDVLVRHLARLDRTGQPAGLGMRKAAGAAAE